MTRKSQIVNRTGCPGVTRRSFLVDTGMGFTGLALGAMLFRDRVAASTVAAPKAKSVIWIFLCGGVSHLESFDVKTELDKYSGKSIDDTPYKSVLENQDRNIVGGNIVQQTIMLTLDFGVPAGTGGGP